MMTDIEERIAPPLFLFPVETFIVSQTPDQPE
jgi:hypothetical protein